MSPARRTTPPRLTEANGEVVPVQTLEELARVAAKRGKLRACVMALICARNFRVDKKLCRDVITLYKEARSDKVSAVDAIVAHHLRHPELCQARKWRMLLPHLLLLASAVLLLHACPMEIHRLATLDREAPLGVAAELGRTARQPRHACILVLARWCALVSSRSVAVNVWMATCRCRARIRWRLQ
jgi:hypothetical protein